MVWTRDFRASTVGIEATNGATPAYIRAITASSAAMAPDVSQEVASGSVYPDVSVFNGQSPVARFTTQDIVGAFTALGLWGSCIAGDVDDFGVRLWAQKQDCSGIASGSVHDTYTVALGIIVPRTLTVDHRGNAQLSYDVIARWDGTNAPIIYAQNQSLSLGATTPVGRWTMEVANVAGQTVSGKRNITLDFGIEVTAEAGDSDPFPTAVSLTQVAPRLTIRGLDTAMFGTVATIAGATATHANTLIELRKRGVDRATAAHVQLTISGLVVIDTPFDASGNAPAESTLMVHGAVDASGNAPMTLTNATALS